MTVLGKLGWVRSWQWPVEGKMPGKEERNNQPPQQSNTRSWGGRCWTCSATKVTGPSSCTWKGHRLT